MREIEIKVTVNNKVDLQSKLSNLGVKLGKPKKQHDVVYGIKHDSEFERQASWLRIRTEDDETVYFTLKKNVTSELDSIEHEIIVDDAETLEKIITTLGFELYSDLTKIRREVAYGDIEIDAITGATGTSDSILRVLQQFTDEVLADLAADIGLE